MERQAGPAKNPGRPKATDSGKTRSAILDAAEIEFARLGPAGARLEAIAERAGVTKALVHHYFENKEHLYELVVSRLLQEQRAKIASLDLEKQPVEQALYALLRYVYLQSAAVGNLAGILIHESLQNEGKAYAKFGGTHFYWTLSSLIKRGVAEGRFREVDATHAAICMAGAFNYYYGIRRNIGLLFENSVDSESEQEKHFNQAWSLVLSGLRNVRSTGENFSGEDV